MQVACLQHAWFEGPGNIARWAATRGHSFSLIHLYKSQPLPCADEIDVLIVMGGPMSVHDDVRYTWLVPEKKLIAQCLTMKKFILGVCLGSQLFGKSCLSEPI
jgi:GMP synthase-like glutamine amidotransferase